MSEKIQLSDYEMFKTIMEDIRHLRSLLQDNNKDHEEIRKEMVQARENTSKEMARMREAASGEQVKVKGFVYGMTVIVGGVVAWIVSHLSLR